jgi:ferredoxin-NADP reductase
MEAVKIATINHITHDTLRLVCEKPEKLSYEPGQAVEVSINKPGWAQEFRPFTFASIPDDPFIEFIIKTYPGHNGVTRQFLSLVQGDELFINDVFGDITYKGEGLFIAGGAGITPFISILRQLERKNEVGNNKLIFANKTRVDIILEDELRRILGKSLINILSEEVNEKYDHGFVSADLINAHIKEHKQFIYICGPDPMMRAVEMHISLLGIEDSLIVRESF